MQSSWPIPGNPWPHDMVITIEDDASPFLELLFLRTAWHLDVTEVPAIEQSDRIPSVKPPEATTPWRLRKEWLAEWRSGWGRYDLQIGAVTPPDRAELELIAATPDEELDTVFGGLGRRFLDETQLDVFNAWRDSLRDQAELPVAGTPERISLPALIAAWERGLKTIVQLPFAGHYAVSRNDEYLVVSRHTRADPQLFSQALTNH